ncbi:MAG: hypothetical protein RI973_1598 [Bacteroidota bacterium]|jgi:3-methyladenine DNA glycosylase AlkD
MSNLPAVMPTDAYLAEIQAIFREKGRPERAQGQMRYMRNQFDFFGLANPEMQAVSRDFIRGHGIPEGGELWALARACFDCAEREMQYFAIFVLERVAKQQPDDFILLLEELITTKSWWDTVDWLAKLVGMHFRKFPGQVLPVTSRWMASGNIWLQRVCLIFQLSYRDKTDFELMKKYILELADSREFFLQKGAGWALRQYARTDPQGVKSFIEQHPELPALTRREGLKRR